MSVSVSSVFDWVEQYAPGFKKSVVGRDILAPPDLERIFGLTGGVDILHCGCCSTEQHFECWHATYLFDTVSYSLDEEVICIIFSVQSLTAYFGTWLLYKQLRVTGSFTTARARIKVHINCVTLNRLTAFASASFVWRKQYLTTREAIFLLIAMEGKTKGKFKLLVLFLQNIFHGSMSLDQLYLTRPLPSLTDYRSPIKGLYLCGSGCHPGLLLMLSWTQNCK